MKKSIGLVLFVFLFLGSYAQQINQSKVPAIVLNAFQLRFPNASDPSWKIKNGDYHVKFEVNNKENHLTLDKRGKTIQHSQDLYLSEIPLSVLLSLKEKAPYYDIHDADKIDEGGRITYELFFKDEGKKNVFWFNEKGKLIKYRKELRDEQIPDPIIETIKSRYSSFELERAKYIEEDDDRFYMVRGEINNYDCLWYINENTSVVRYEQDVGNSKLPVPVISSIHKSYGDCEIRDADRIEENGEVSYKVRLRKSRETFYVNFDSSGKVINEK